MASYSVRQDIFRALSDRCKYPVGTTFSAFEYAEYLKKDIPYVDERVKDFESNVRVALEDIVRLKDYSKTINAYPIRLKKHPSTQLEPVKYEIIL